MEVEACRNLGPCIASDRRHWYIWSHGIPTVDLIFHLFPRPQDPSLEIFVILWAEEADFGPSICGVYHCDRAGSMMSLLPSTPLSVFYCS